MTHDYPQVNPPAPTTNLNFGQAIEALKQGKRVHRAIWGGFWFIPTVITMSSDHHAAAYYRSEDPRMIIAVLKEGGLAAAQPYQEDILAEDWVIMQ